MYRTFCCLSVFLACVSCVFADADEDKAVEFVLAKGGIFLPSIDDPPKRPTPNQPIREIRFPDSDWKDEDMKTLDAFKQLKRVWLCRLKITDAGLKELDRIKTLEELHIQRCKGITGKGFNALPRCEKLQKIVLEGPATDATIQELASLKNLRELSLVLFAPVTGEGLGALSELPSLEKLYLVSPETSTEAGVRKVASLKGLRHLALSSPGVTDAALRGLSGLKRLEELSLSGESKLTDAVLEEVRGLPKLRSLELAGMVEGKGLKGLAGLTELRELTLRGRVTDAGLREMATLKQLHRLSIFSSEITAAGIRELAPMIELRELTFQLPQGVREKEEVQKVLMELRKALPKCKVESN
jgi:hypothetical protein